MMNPSKSRITRMLTAIWKFLFKIIFLSPLCLHRY
jgi:hypothetical protein